MRCRGTFVAAVRLPTRGLIVLIACLLVVAQGCGGDDDSGGGGTGGRDSGSGGATGGTSADSSTAGGGTGGQGGTGGTTGTGGAADGAVTDAQGGGPADASADASDGGPCDDGNACTTDILTGGQCAHVPVVCMALDQCHNAGTCDPATGACSNPNKTDGTACNDNNSCTQTDDCQAGVCTGSNPVVCTALDQCHDVGVCDTATGACSNPNKVDGATCNDGDACTRVDTCVAGACTGSDPVVCTALDQCHDVGVCDTATGVCSNPNKTDGTGCDDANLCTRSDTCVAGACTGADPVSCSGTDECHTPGTCDPATGGCDSPSAPDGTTCNDNNPCTQSSSCQLGVCTGANPIVCTALDDCHDPGVCQQATGTCTNPNKTNGTACSTDGNACTQTDTCENGTCTGSNPIVCTALDQCHIPGTCDPGTGQCDNPPIVDGAVCNDNNACTLSSTCQAGSCQGTNPFVCPAPDQCHNPGICDPLSGDCNYTNRADGTTCNDNNACTLSSTCQAGSCTGTPIVCPPPGQCQDAGVCDTITGTCNYQDKLNGTVCNDGNACTQTDACVNGACAGSNLVQCPAPNQCHSAGACDVLTGDCVDQPLPNGTVCNDNNACTQTDTCQGGACTGANLITCNPSDQCHNAGTCNPATGTCSNPPKVDGSACSDGDACTQSDTCIGGTCEGANPIVCPTPDQCHDPGVCNPGTGVCNNPARPNGSPCDDSSFCTLNETCQAGACTPASTVQCTASDQCHDPGVCNPATGSCSNPPKAEGSTCNDNNGCTTVDTCVSGACTGSVPVVCQALDQCHDAGVCNPATGACSNPNKPDGELCTDNDACTTGDSCQLGSCTPAGSVVCQASDQCHNAGTCDPATGNCDNPEKPFGTPCNDGLTCTTFDSCVAGACGGDAPNCDDGIACTIDQCVEPGGCQSQPDPTCGCTNDAQCEDGNLCNGVSICDLANGNCIETVPPKDCSPFEDACNTSACDAVTGLCVPQPRADGTPCSDGNACTQTDACSSGTCQGSNPIVCTALNQCHNPGVCDQLSGACSNPQKLAGTACSDGNACTQGDACGVTASGFGCIGGPGAVCNPSGPCREAGTCDPGTGLCSDPPSPDGTPCNDGLTCTQTDVCQSGACAGTNQIICPPPTSQCQGAGTCIELPPPLGWSCDYPNSPDGTPCNDGSGCTGPDACSSGMCTGPGPNKCITSTVPMPPGCDACVDQICTADPFCCQTAWDSICVNEVLSVCGSVECSCGDGNCIGAENNGNCPADCCHDALLTSAVPSSTPGTTVGFDNSYTPTCATSNAPDFIFQFTAPFTGTFSFDTLNSNPNFDTILVALQSCGGPELACDDDGAGNVKSRIELSLTGGQTVQIVVDGFSTHSGDFVLNVNQVTICNGDNVCTPPEDSNNCYDCHCGDNVCDATENVNSCPWDCGAGCPDGVCSPAFGEDFNGCTDCFCGDAYCSKPLNDDFNGCPECFFCGDGVCARSLEDPFLCPQDCSTCGDGQCLPSAGESIATCPSDCFCGDGICASSDTPPFAMDCDCFCGDGICSPAFEDPTTCFDCSCGDGVCDPNWENRSTCFFDCQCGDGVCDNHEAANGNCPADCQTAGSCLSHTVCEIGSQLEPGCDPLGCVGFICNSWDPSCCFPTGGVPPTWDAHCVNLAQWQCGVRCP